MSADPPTPHWRLLLERALTFLEHRPWLVPLLSFVVGWVSYAAIQRGERLARWVAVVALLGWLVLLAQDTLGGWIARWSRGRLQGRWLHFVVQSLQQEIFFFTLPFLIAATQWDVGQIAFTSLVALAALASTIDPLYKLGIASAAGRSLVFHAFCTFLTVLVVLPLSLHLPMDRTLNLAVLLTMALALLSVPRLLRGAGGGRVVLRLGVLVSVLGALWLCRAHIPPAGLKVQQALVTARVSNALVPGEALETIPAAQLHEGVYAFVAVRAPLGLSQDIHFDWLQNGVRVDRISGTIRGGRQAGYRSFSRKENFPLDPRGDWTVELRAAGGQLICRLRFRVA